MREKFSRQAPKEADVYEPPAGAERMTRTPGDSHLSLERWKFKTRKKKKKKSAQVSSQAPDSSEEDEDEEEEEDLVKDETWGGRMAKSLAGRLLKRERRSLDSAGSSEFSSSEDGNKRHIWAFG